MNNKITLFCMDPYEINDVRDPKDFQGISFSGFKKSDVKKELIKNLLKGNIEPSCYWTAEYICAGHYGELWEIILFFFGKHIHIGNPKILLYLQKRFAYFKDLIHSSKFINELQTRNSLKIRQLFAEIVCVLCLSKKQFSIEPVKINRKEEFDITNMQEHLIATSTDLIQPIFQKKDPKELLIPFNEFVFNLQNNDCRRASYWIEWLLEFDLLCRKKKQKSACELRNYNVLDKFRGDIVWIVWDIFYHIASTRNDKFIENILDALLDIFCIKYTTTSCKKRRFLLYFGVTLLTENVQRNIDVFQSKQVIQNVINNVNMLYKQIKKNEHSPNTDYLFSNLTKQNTIEKSLRQLEMINSVDFQTNTS